MSLKELRTKLIKKIESAERPDELESIKHELLGKNSELSKQLKSLSLVPEKKRKKTGQSLNLLKEEVVEAYRNKIKQLKITSLKKEQEKDVIDVSLSGKKTSFGTLHPVTSTILDICNFFTMLGFDIVSGPEAETDYYNFEALNIPKDHPAKDMHDTFYLDEGSILRTHTSPVQIRTIEKQDPPLRIICPGRVYRKDSDLTHTPMFHQIEGLVIEENASFSVLKGLLNEFIADFFRKEIELRFRPSYFPFTEPSAEVDLKWKKGWLEILGCGMVHPNVLENSGVNSKKYSGFAFGLGAERMAMLKYDIPDLRSFFENDLRFLKQFK